MWVDGSRVAETGFGDHVESNAPEQPSAAYPVLENCPAGVGAGVVGADVGMGVGGGGGPVVGVGVGAGGGPAEAMAALIAEVTELMDSKLS